MKTGTGTTGGTFNEGKKPFSINFLDQFFNTVKRYWFLFISLFTVTLLMLLFDAIK